MKQFKINNLGDKVISIPNKIYRGIHVNLEELQLLELYGIDIIPPKEPIINEHGEKTVGDGNEYGVYMTDNKTVAESYAYRKGDNVQSIDNQLPSIKVGSENPKIGLSTIGILYEISTDGLNIRNPKYIDSLGGHYNNGFPGHEWIAEYVPSENYNITEVRIGHDILHDERKIPVISDVQRQKLKNSIINIMHERKTRLNDFVNYIKNNSNRTTFQPEELEVFKAVFGEDGVKYISYDDIEPIKNTGDVMKYLMLKTYEKNSEDIDFQTFRCLLDIQRSIEDGPENRVANKLYGRNVVLQLISQRLNHELSKRDDYISRKGKQASTVNFDNRIATLEELEKLLDDLEKRNIQSSIVQSGVEAGIEANITTSQINEQTSTIREQGQINQLLEELGDCVEFLDTNQMKDRLYLEILKKHRDFYDDPSDAVAIADSEYERICEKENSGEVEEIDKIDSEDIR